MHVSTIQGSDALGKYHICDQFAITVNFLDYFPCRNPGINQGIKSGTKRYGKVKYQEVTNVPILEFTSQNGSSTNQRIAVTS